VVRLVSFALMTSVAGLSSSFALCVSACTNEAASAMASHACHDQTGGISLAAGDGTCPHGPSIVPQGDITRDDRAPVVSLTASVVTGWAVRTPAGANPPARPVSCPPILRI
jgi:hypothetical protein